MNWKLILIFTTACNIELFSSCLYGPSNRAKWQQESHLEELHDHQFLTLLNFMSTFCDLGDKLDDNDIKLLSSECGTDLYCLYIKNKSTQNYHRKIEQVEIFNKHFVSIIFGNIQNLMSSGEKSSLEILVKYYIKYVTRMLSMLHTAKRKPEKWLVDMIIFLHFVVSMKLETFTFFKYIIISNNPEYPTETYSFLSLIGNLYNNDKLDYAYKNAQLITVPNLLLFHLHEKHEDLTQKLELEIKLDWTSVNSKLLRIAYYKKHNLEHDLKLFLIGYHKYHTLFLSCIRLRILFHTWFHVKLSYTMLSTYNKTWGLFRSKEIEKSDEEQLCQHWYALVVPLKGIMRFFSIKDGIFWIALRNVMDDISKFSEEELLQLEVLLKNEFLRNVKILNLGEENNVVQQMEDVSFVETPMENYDKITSNSENLIKYTNHLQEFLTPMDASFLNWCFEENQS